MRSAVVPPRLDASSFRAMGTDVALLAGAGDPAMNAARAIVRSTFEEEEHRFSRFRADSELSRVNRSAGSWTWVDAAFEEVVRAAMEGARSTDGRFDPTVLDAISAAGYDRDFDEVIAGARGALRPPRPCGRWREVRVRPGAVLLPVGVGLDLGGIAKGWTVDLAAERAVAAGLPWALVNAGGDLRLAGSAPAIEIGVDDPDVPGTEVLRLRLEAGALATSSTRRRAWGDGLHHVIDPRTGAPSSTDVIQATVWGATCAAAEVSATDALLAGRVAAGRLRGALITVEGDVLVSMTQAGEAA